MCCAAARAVGKEKRAMRRLVTPLALRSTRDAAPRPGRPIETTRADPARDRPLAGMPSASLALVAMGIESNRSGPGLHGVPTPRPAQLELGAVEVDNHFASFSAVASPADRLLEPERFFQARP